MPKSTTARSKLNIIDEQRIKELSPEKVIQYFQNNEISFTAINEDQESALHIAILNQVDALDLVKKLFGQESSLKNTLNTPLANNETLLIFAARYINNDNLDIMKFLVENGANPEAQTQDNKPINSLLSSNLKQQWQDFLQDYKAKKQLGLEQKQIKKTQPSESFYDFFSNFFKQTSSSIDEQKTPLLAEQKFKKD